MMKEETNLVVADNSCAKKVRCIRVLGGSGRQYASLGDLIVVSVKTAIPNGTVKKGEVSRAVIVRTKKEAPIHVSNVMLIDPKSNKPTRIGSQIILDEKTKKNKRIRVSRISGEMIQ